MLLRPDATRELARRFRLSERQARRYVERARDEGPVEIPRSKVVFTVKLTADLIRSVRGGARASGRSISAFVSQALEEFLEHARGSPPP